LFKRKSKKDLSLFYSKCK